MPFQWTGQAYERSISSRCWWYTLYDGGKWSELVRKDDELKQIVEIEYALGDVPKWAQQIVERSINQACPCGHYLFPQPYLEVVSAIGSRTPRTFVHSCFTVERERKRQAMDYCLCLDAWLAGARPEASAHELAALGYRKIDWHTVCADLWQALGERNEVKELLVERVLHNIRWSIKFTFWDDDLASEFGRDQYLGEYARTDDEASIDGYYARPPFYYEKGSPRVQRLEARLDVVCPNWQTWYDQMVEWWLCAPKSFRFLERMLWAIGRERPEQPAGQVPGFLQCRDTYPNQDDAAEWWTAFCAALDSWWRGHSASGNVAEQVNRRLGEVTPAKRWLVRLFLRKLKRLEENGEQLAHLVSAQHRHKRGTKPLQGTLEDAMKTPV